MADYIRVHVERQHDPGYVGLCIAENHQVRDLLRVKLDAAPPVPGSLTGYDAMAGRDGLPTAVARLLGDRVAHRPIDPAHVQVLTGAGAVLDAVGHALGDPGDGVLVPTPSYSGFWPDLEVRPGLRMLPVPTDTADGFRLTPALLDRAVDSAEAPVRILLLTNPDNPRGQLLAAQDLEAILAWAERTGIHVIADELYALTTFGPRPFTSVAQLRPQLGEHLHLVWAFSKDFAMSGMRVGVLVSENEALRQAVELQGIWAGVSSHTQHLIAAMLADEAWVERFLREMREGLRTAAARVTSALQSGGIPHLVPEAGFFVLCDLRTYLGEPTWAAEERLWWRILEQVGANLTPGSALRAPEPGWFRLCYASNPSETVEAAIVRIAEALADG